MKKERIYVANYLSKKMAYSWTKDKAVAMVALENIKKGELLMVSNSFMCPSYKELEAIHKSRPIHAGNTRKVFLEKESVLSLMNCISPFCSTEPNNCKERTRSIGEVIYGF
jgi:hypothetical protein